MARTLRRLATPVLALALAVGLLSGPTAGAVGTTAGAAGSGAAGSGMTAGDDPAYANPVSQSFSDTFPDPSVIKGKDGFWYAFATGAPVRHREGDHSQRTPVIAKSADLVTWEYVGDVFTEANLPEWIPTTGNTVYWAPDIRYFNGEYQLYFTARNNPGFHTYIGLATAPTPAGPWTDSGAPVVSSSGTLHTFSIDAAHFADDDGRRYLYWGSYRETGLLAAELSTDGRRLVSEPRQVAASGEAPQVVRRGDHYYLLLSDSTCCSGVNSGYTVTVGRGDSPVGPFFDREGVALADNRYGGTTVLTSNGNRWVGTGHQAIATDLAGQDWLAYHAIDRTKPNLDPPLGGLLARPMMLDRLDWVDGWPTVRAGAWASDTPQPGPVTTPDAGGDFNSGASLEGWRREGAAGDGWSLESEPQSGGHARQNAPAARPGYLVSTASAPAEVRAEADLRVAPQPGGADGSVGLTAAYRDPRNHVVAWLDAGRRSLVTDVLVDGASVGRQSTPLPDGVDPADWHHVALEIRSGTMTVEVTDARMSDPLARQSRQLPPGVATSGAVGAAALGARAEADNVVATALHRPVTQPAATPQVGELDPDHSDEFSDGVLDPAWSWVRDPDGEEVDGAYRWPTQDADLRPAERTASLLLRDAPDGDWTIETRMSLPLRPDSSTALHQAGLVVHADDDHHVRLTPAQTHPLYAAPSSIRLTHVMFSRQEGGGFGWLPVAAATDSLWLRISHRTDPENGEHEFRAAVSRDGTSWTWGGVWTLAADVEPRVGLLSLGGTGTTAEFDHFRLYRP